MAYIAAGNTDVGLARKENQDNFLILPDEKVYAVADGMGGHAGGRLASAITVEVLRECLTGLEKISRDTVEKALVSANEKILQTGQDKRMKGMGTTLVLTFFEEASGLWQIVHIGDSRAYVITEAEIYSLTRDHSLVGELLAQGSITAQEAKNHPHRHILTRALGMPGGPGGEWTEIAAAKAPRLLLCTDGLYNMLETEEIQSLALLPGRSPAEKALELIEAAKEQGGLDNITVILIEEEGRACFSREPY
ncbi:MAG: protein phosphatase 2C domain-containing protein [Peptococcaceae bacterium]|nr:protein phosphatase 2C domain-containing protein [Peptococcaceae bacterium]